MIYLDIETATVAWDALDEGTQDQWVKFCERRYPDNEPYEDIWYDKAALHPEFALICCVSYAFGVSGDIYHVTAAIPAEEFDLLTRVSEGLARNPRIKLCAHNGKGFDYHFLARRMVINGVKLPDQLNTMGKKPWEVNLDDTQELWGFGDMRRTVSLDLLCFVLGVDSPKDGITGKDVPQAWRDGRIEEIAAYCDKDVKALQQVHKKLINA